MAHGRAPAVAAVGLLLAGCGGAGGPLTTVSGDGGSDAAGVAEGTTVTCGGSTYEPGAVAGSPSPASLPEGPAGAVDDAGAPAFDPSQDWKVVHRSDGRVELVRELDEPFDNGGGDVRTHEVRVLERISGSTNVPDGTWLLTSAGPCAQRLAGGGDLGAADLTLAEATSPLDTSVDLLVQERACASGESADGRIELLDLVLTADEVRLRVGVRPRAGGQDCQGNPPTPFTVELGGPLGEREVVDASVVPPRPLTVAADG